MKKTQLILLAVVVFAGLLAGCKGKETPEPLSVQLPVATATSAYDPWEYQTVLLQCQADQQTGSLVCYNIKDNDMTMLDGYLKSLGNQGWELVQILETDPNAEDGPYQTLIFKRMKLRPAAVPVEEPTAEE